MSRTNTTPDLAATGLLPARLADAQLEHMERLVQYWTHADAVLARRGIDHEYWKQRLRALAQTYDLATSQRQRLLAMLDLIEREAALKAQTGFDA
ncbi:hypothetical protein [Paraburkholderia ferrariae]|uniref:hypothetical protein n=1 Tax=Paraburkholderia ferrariae TaxID=386056 RepID=UPI0005A9A779|nr:hypothetical protein [Paraburkholderia ferrariae]